MPRWTRTAFPETRVPVTVLQVLPEVDPGGAERIVLSLARHLPGDRFHVEIATLDGRGSLAEEFRSLGCPVRDLGVKDSLHLIVAGRRLRELIGAVRPAIVHSHLLRAHLAAAGAGRCPGVVATAATEHQADPRRWALRLLRRATRRTTIVTAVSDGVRRHLLAAGFDAGRVTTIANGIELDPIDRAARLAPAELGLPPEARMALFVGRLTRQKGLDVLLAAMARLAPDVPAIHLLVAGDGEARSSLEGLASRLGLSARVHFLGRRDDVSQLMKTAHLAVLPSRWEGLSLVLLEAMAAGLPVVATRVEGQAEVIEDGVSGLLVPSEDPAGLAEAMRRLLGDAALSARLGEAAAEKVRREHSAETMAARYAELYNHLLAAGPGGGGR